MRSRGLGLVLMTGGAATVIATAAFIAMRIAIFVIEAPALHRPQSLFVVSALGIIVGAYTLQWGRNLWKGDYSIAEDRTLVDLLTAVACPWRH